VRKRNLTNLTERDLRGINRWLQMDKEKGGNHCPFHRDCSKCADIFPCYKDTQEYSLKLCPCGLYPIQYVTRVARQILREKEKEKKDENDK
jgi:hypothetical protein